MLCPDTEHYFDTFGREYLSYNCFREINKKRLKEKEDEIKREFEKMGMPMKSEPQKKRRKVGPNNKGKKKEGDSNATRAKSKRTAVRILPTLFVILCLPSLSSNNHDAVLNLNILVPFL